ncbi:MAG: HAD-IA family hydrolase [Eubacteriales bacterium]|nr:HAD-IA family hydrolase [Eubacteriales bacterium]
MARFSLLLSDVDNTLFDFRSAERAAYATVSARFALPDEEDVFKLYKAVNTFHWKKLSRGETTAARLRHDRFADFAAAMGLPDADVPEMSALFVRTLELEHTPVEGAEEFLSRVSARMPVCLVTNGFASVQRSRMKLSPLRRYIADVLVSEEFAHAKPDPEMLFAAMERMKISDPARVAMIGDNENTDILAAKNAGVQSILFTNGGPAPAETAATYTAATLADAADWLLKD